MKFPVASAVLVMITAATLSAQGGDPDHVVANGGVSVPGWTGRLDPRPASQGRKITEAKFYPMGKGIHATAGPAAIYWNPANKAPAANYNVHATFTQEAASAHPEAYGLIFGGNNLTSADQSYMYFIIRQDGKFMINHRANDSTVHKLVDWTANSAVKPIDATGKVTNALSVSVGPTKVGFWVNGIEVQSLPRAQVNTDGIAGIRVNHNLDVHIDGFGIAPEK